MLKLIRAKKKEYSEIAQQKKVLFSFVNRKKEELHEMFYPVNCRDFLNDVLVAEESKEKVAIYGFRYNPHEQVLDRKATRFLITCDAEDRDTIIDNIGLLWDIEKTNNIKRTIFYGVEGELYIEASPIWLQSTFGISLYTFLIKALAYQYNDYNTWIEELAKQDTNEGKYVSPNVKEFKLLLLNIKKVILHKKTVSGYSKDYGYRYIHNNSGLVTLLEPSKKNLKDIAENPYRKVMDTLIGEANV